MQKVSDHKGKANFFPVLFKNYATVLKKKCKFIRFPSNNKTKQIVKSEIKLDLPLIVPDFVYIFHMIWLNAIYFIGWKPEKFAFFF
jgi:hypothetical protein